MSTLDSIVLVYLPISGITQSCPSLNNLYMTKNEHLTLPRHTTKGKLGIVSFLFPQARMDLEP
jgi:hypothetical protein